MKFIFALVLLAITTPSAYAVKPCSVLPMPDIKRQFKASQLDAVLLRKLIGAEIAYSGKYAPHDLDDARVIEGSGIITSVALWPNDSVPSFSIRLLTLNGDFRNLQVASDDKSFRLTLIEASELNKLLKDAKADGLLTRFPEYHSGAKDDDFFSSPRNQNLRVFYVEGSGSETDPFKIIQVNSLGTVVPTAYETALAIINGTEIQYTFRTSERELRINHLRLLAVAY